MTVLSVELFFSPENLPSKTVPVIDNAPKHPDVEELKSGVLKVLFLPPKLIPAVNLCIKVCWER